MSQPATVKCQMAYDSFFGDLTMKKLFALMVVFAALVAAGCAERDTTPMPADNQAAPAEEKPADGAPADDTATQNP
ncbi:MAG: hypothetical protein WD229_02505 [Pirellulales bacterium]